MILRISTAIRSELDIDAVLKIAVTEVGMAFGASRCAYVPFSDDPVLGPSHQFVAPGIPIGTYGVDRGANPHIPPFLGGKPLVVPDVDADPYYRTRTDLKALAIRSVLSVPVIDQGRVMAGLSLHQCDGARHWSDDEITCLSIIADQLALALRAAAQHAQAVPQSEELERALSELEGVDRLKFNLLATVTHELRTPLNDIVTYASSIADGVFGPVNAEVQGALDRVLDGGDRLRFLIDQMLDASRLAVGSLNVAMTEVDFAALCEAVAAPFRHQAEARGLAFELEVGSIPDVHADPDCLSQVLRHLVANALKFTSLGGLRLRVLAEGDGVTTEVEDSGIGIERDHHARIFDPFYQVDSGHTRRYGGAGLGLYLADRFLAAMGSVLEVESELGRGSTFRFRLPSAP